jgi:hypothetical protein
MRALTKLDLLSLWETGAGMHPLDQGLLAIRFAFPEAASDDPAGWPLGRRNRALAELRCAAFGTSLQGWTACPRCGEKLEFAMDSLALAAGSPAALPDPAAAGPIIVDGHAFRLPTSRDLARIAGEPDPSLAARRLIEECRVEKQSSAAWPPDSSAPPSLEPELFDREFLNEVEVKLAAADPLAEIMLAFDCPVCGAICDKPLDLAAFLWAEISAIARRMLADIHTLASAYSWSESEILSLSDTRRAVYLDMVRA